MVTCRGGGVAAPAGPASWCREVAALAPLSQGRHSSSRDRRRRHERRHERRRRRRRLTEPITAAHHSRRTKRTRCFPGSALHLRFTNVRGRCLPTSATTCHPASVQARRAAYRRRRPHATASLAGTTHAAEANLRRVGSSPHASTATASGMKQRISGGSRSTSPASVRRATAEQRPLRCRFASRWRECEWRSGRQSSVWSDARRGH